MYLGMTKYWFLETKTYTKAAIICFTADHGDMLGDRHHKGQAERPEARLDVRKLFSKYIGYDLRTQDGEW